ncbi:ALK and LTK ligand 2b isoform 1-T3 [Polymixia lowei]
MTALRSPVLLVLAVLLLTAGRCRPRAVPMAPGVGPGILELLADEAQPTPQETPNAAVLTGHQVTRPQFTSEPRSGQDANKPQPILEVYTRDLRHKEKFLKHLTGPLYFNPKCRKSFYRLYHTARDCTIPAYYKRCARLLTRLAGSPRCTER